MSRTEPGQGDRKDGKPAGNAAPAAKGQPGAARGSTGVKGGQAGPNRRQEPFAQRQRRRRQQRLAAIGSVGLVVVVIAVLVVVKLASSSGSGGTPSPTAFETAVDPTIVATISAVPVSTLAHAAATVKVAAPTALTGAPLTASGKPEVLYIGAGFCPFCAATRWPLVMALSKFGTFTGLNQTSSSSSDEFPNTATFSFHGSSYTSAYLTFVGIETTTNQPQGNGYVPLDTPTAAESQVQAASGAGHSIPFIDFGGKALMVGTSYSPGVLSGRTIAEIAQQISDPSTQIAMNVDAVAGVFTSELCQLTGDQPSTVCSAFAS